VLINLQPGGGVFIGEKATTLDTLPADLSQTLRADDPTLPADRAAGLHPRRQDGPLRRLHGGDEHPAGQRLLSGRPDQRRNLSSVRRRFRKSPPAQAGGLFRAREGEPKTTEGPPRFSPGRTRRRRSQRPSWGRTKPSACELVQRTALPQEGSTNRRAGRCSDMHRDARMCTLARTTIVNLRGGKRPVHRRDADHPGPAGAGPGGQVGERPHAAANLTSAANPGSGTAPSWRSSINFISTAT
jgi:hypothetical protein